MLTEPLQSVLTVRCCQVQKAYSVLRWQVHCVCVEVLEKGTVHRVRELVYLYHFLHVLIPIGLKHGPEVLAPDLQNSFMDVNIFPINSKLQICSFWTIKFFLQ